MARLRTTNATTTWIVPSQCLIGRSRACHVRLDDAKVSAEHALLRWRGGAWELQDLHSRNGTYVDGRPLGSGQKLGLEEGARLEFGRRDDEYVLSDAGPPEPHAVGVDLPHVTVEAHDGYLTLPSVAEPEVCVIYRDQGWWLESENDVVPVADGKIVTTRGGTWRLHLPERLPPTADTKDAALTLASISLRFVIAEDGTPVTLVLQRGERRIPLKARAHHAPLLALARARLAERALVSDEQGWLQQEQLLGQLGYDSGRLHVEIHRIRRQLAKAGVLDAVNVVERRQGTRQLRCGVAALEVIMADPAPPGPAQ